MATLTLRSIFDFLLGLPEALAPIFWGSTWPQIAFQAYTILGLSAFSIYKIIKVRGPSVVIISRTRLVLSALLTAALYLGFHRAVVYFIPVDPGWGKKFIFLLVSWLALAFIPYHLGNLISHLLNRFGGGPYVLELSGAETSGNAFWDEFFKVGQAFVRRIHNYYYLNGLYVPMILLFLFSGLPLAQLLVLVYWFISFVVLVLLRIHGVMDLYTYVYFGLLFWASNYYVAMYGAGK